MKLSRPVLALLLFVLCLAGSGCGIPAAISSPLSAIRPGDTLEEDDWRGKLIEPANATAGSPEPLRVMSFNLRVRTPVDAFNGWAFRRDLVQATIDNFDPDILGTQEGNMSQIDDLQPRLPDHAFVGVGRDDGDRRGETAGIFYRRDRFELKDSGHFWLSDTPDEVASRSWGNLFNRMTTWVRLRDLEHPERGELFVFNTHFDAFSANARQESAKLLQRKIGRIAGRQPVVVTGDFNAGEGSEPYQVLVHGEGGGVRDLTDAYRHVHPERGEAEGTRHSFRGGTGGERIDWILTCEKLRPVAAAIDHTRAGRRFPSDHFPVSAVLLYEEDEDATPMTAERPAATGREAERREADGS